MKIGIIGAGEIGGTLTRRFAALGHDVSVANSRGPETLADLARETGAKAVPARDAARAGKLVIVTIPEGKIPNLQKDLFAGVPPDVVVVDTGNYYPQRDGQIAGIENGMTESLWVATQLGRSVVKAFNNINVSAGKWAPQRNSGAYCPASSGRRPTCQTSRDAIGGRTRV